ncbi:MAG: isocitrate/isopropylmalate family dehydrogenase, partial [Chloroflexota bacterium]
MNSYKIAVLPGDGIGREIMPWATKVLDAAAKKHGTFQLEYNEFPWGCEYCLETGVVMPDDGIDQLRPHDAIYFVAAGHPDVVDWRSAWEFIFMMRKHFKQYCNLRPITSWPGVDTLLKKDHGDIDFVIVRENSEGEYTGAGGVIHEGFDNSLCVQTTVFTQQGIERIGRVAFDLARQRNNRVTNVTKSNALRPSMVFWDQIMAKVAEEYPDVEYEILYIDAATMKFIQNPGWFDVIVTTNMYVDILSDLGGALIVSVGLCPSTNMNPEKDYQSMFEPVHGSAP